MLPGIDLFCRASHRLWLMQGAAYGPISKILERADPVLFHHLRHIKAADCFFAFRMVIVQLRREMPMEQVRNIWRYPASLAICRVSSEMYSPQTFVALVRITEKTGKWVESIRPSMQAMTLWEVLWAEDYWNQMDKWMPAMSGRSHDQSLVSAILSLIEFKHLSVHNLLLPPLLYLSTHHLA